MDKIEELKKLQQLLEEGLISKIEFESLKAEIMGGKAPEVPQEKQEAPQEKAAEPTPEPEIETTIPAEIKIEEVVEKPVEKVEERIERPAEPQSKSNKTALIIVLSLVGVVALFFIIKLVFFQAEVRDDSIVETNEDVAASENATLPEDIVISATASSFIAPSVGLDYDPANAIDTDLNTWWSPQTNQSGPKWLQLSFNAASYISSIRIHGGSHHPNYSSAGKNYGNLFYKNLRIKRARLDFSDGSHQFIDLRDVDAMQEIILNESVMTTFVKIVPLDSYSQVDGWDDYCISEVEFTFTQ